MSSRLAAEVGGDDRGAGVALEAPPRDADPDPPVRRLQEVGAVAGAREPHGDDRARARIGARAPGEVLAREAEDVESVHPPGEVAVGERAGAEEAGRPRPGRTPEARIDLQRP